MLSSLDEAGEKLLELDKLRQEAAELDRRIAQCSARLRTVLIAATVIAAMTILLHLLPI